MSTHTIVIVQPIGSSFAIVGASSSASASGALLGGGFELARAVVVSDLDPSARDLQALADHGPAAITAEDIGLPLSGVRVDGPAVSARVTDPEAVRAWRAVLGA